MSALKRGVYIVGAKRTPFGSFGGKLKDKTATELGEIAAKAALQSANVKPEMVDSVTFGCVNQLSSAGGAYIARHIGLRAGLPNHVPALTVNRLCGSGFQATVTGAQEICLHDAEIVLTGGTENMSQSPYVVYGSRFGPKLGVDYTLSDSLWNTLTDHHIKLPMGITAENLAEKYKISREDVDKFAIQSQTRWKEAQAAGKFKSEMAPISLKIKGQEVVMDVDEHPKPTTTLEAISKLTPVFKKNGTVTAANASGICDGAGAVVLASEDAVKKHSLKPLARIIGYSYVGCDPTIMGIGPVMAIQKVCAATGIKLNNVDIVDVNEAFASQFLSVQKELNLDPSKTNVNGGAIAMGHPVGASGARILANLVYELQSRGGKYAIGSACIGGGQGIAILLENVK